MADLISKSGIPTVNLSDIYGDQGLPSIWNDHEAIGQLAADHLLQRGLKRFAFCGFTNHQWSEARYRGFQNHLRPHDADILFHSSDWAQARRTGWEAQQAKMVQWLLELPKPIGVLACNVFRGQHVLEACRVAQIPVPDKVAVIGVDNDQVISKAVPTSARKTATIFYRRCTGMLATTSFAVHFHLLFTAGGDVSIYGRTDGVGNVSASGYCWNEKTDSLAGRVICINASTDLPISLQQ